MVFTNEPIQPVFEEKNFGHAFIGAVMDEEKPEILTLVRTNGTTLDFELTNEGAYMWCKTFGLEKSILELAELLEKIALDIERQIKEAELLRSLLMLATEKKAC